MEQQPYFIPPPAGKFLELERPLVFFDLETTGTSVSSDRIIELCAIKLNPDGTQEELHELLNPTIPIPAGATAVHKITDEMVKGKPTFAEKAAEFANFFCNCDLGGYNIRRFDVPMLMEEFHRCKKYPIVVKDVKLVDVMGIFHSKEKRDLAGAVRFYCEREHEGAHGAKADILATIDVLKKQLLRYDDLQPNTSFLHDYLGGGKLVDPSGKFIRNDEGIIVFNFGKHYGRPADSDPDYLQWMMKGDFTVDTKMAIKRILKNIEWKRDVHGWLQEQKIDGNESLAATLYAVLKNGEDIFPFQRRIENGTLSIIYSMEPPSFYTFPDKDAQDLMLQALEAQVQEA
ncbi:3'-5' exonuclease [Flaviaesturariibacter flavus]|uniref:3'-5' exonuclease n=2 Tax=Flaviaesturariibacter flavus TaxID=2502780 RepID=A0A4R1BAK0_9BACT|nr:3'-5' exonuclease [Flaviaesturariibacter flavus]